MPELDAEHRDQLAEALQRALWMRGWLDNGDARDAAPEVRDALAPLVAGWLADARAGGWDESVQAVAWCLDNGEPSAAAALAYVAENNPYRGGDDG